MFTRLSIVAFSIMCALLLLSVTVHANGVPVIPGDPAGILLPHQQTEVGVFSETLTFDFRVIDPKNLQWAPLVTVEYTLSNPSDKAETLTVAFVSVQRAWDFCGKWNDHDIDISDISLLRGGAGEIDLELGAIEMHWLNPWTGGRYAAFPVDGGRLKADLFQISLQPGERGSLHLSFRQDRSGGDWRLPLVHGLAHYTYLLRPRNTGPFSATSQCASSPHRA